MIPGVLIIENDAATTRCFLEPLARCGIRAAVAADLARARELLESAATAQVAPYRLAIISTTIAETARTALEFAAAVRGPAPELPVILLCGQMSQAQTAQVTAAALKAGCCEVLVKPCTQRQAQLVIDTYLPQASAPSIIDEPESVDRIIGSSRSLKNAIATAAKAAPTSAPVLICGESGTGKELLAGLIHRKSRRANGPYVRINCAALNESLLESELFGHEKGAFTGAFFQRKGKFEQAHGGTLLLDEITETGPRLQAQLLRILEQHQFQRVGGCDDVRVNVRIISTTNRDLAEEVRGRKFRADLYYRLGGVRLTVPPLRNRLEDLTPLVWHFVGLYAGECGRGIETLDPGLLDAFSRCQWPGNIRQLKNVVRTCLILGTGPMLALSDPAWLEDPAESSADASEHCGAVSLEEVEQRTILNTLRHTDGNQSRAAKILGISDRTLREKMKRYREETVSVR